MCYIYMCYIYVLYICAIYNSGSHEKLLFLLSPNVCEEVVSVLSNEYVCWAFTVTSCWFGSYLCFRCQVVY